MTDVAIDISGVAKHYPVFRRPADALRYLWNATISGKPRLPQGKPVVRALDDVNLTIQKGEGVGIIGRNGAGKTTLLKMLAGNFPPSAGRLSVHGQVYTLMRDTVSFSPDLSTYDNARNHLAYFQLTLGEVMARLADIEAFTELGEYFHQPVKNYSLGMRMRAEFAVATSQSADIVMIDEVLGAGDIYWAEKIAARMDLLCAQGSTLLLVSHSLDQIMRFCERVVWIERGRVVMDGPAVEVTKRYESFLERLGWHTDDADDKTVDLESVLPDLGNVVLPDSGQTVVRWPGRGDALLTGVWINGRADTDQEVPAGTPLLFRLSTTAVRAGRYVLRYLITFWDSRGKRFAVVENDKDEVVLSEGSRHEITVELGQIDLTGGSYFVTISLFDVSGHATTANEQMTRLDVLYKSFHLHINGSSTSPQPCYRIPLRVDACG